MSAETTGAVYWDSSAILSALFRDRHSEEASKVARRSAVHFLSTLAWAEVHTVVARIERERALAKVLVAAAREALEGGPWRHLNAVPEWKVYGTYPRGGRSEGPIFGTWLRPKPFRASCPN